MRSWARRSARLDHRRDPPGPGAVSKESRPVPRRDVGERVALGILDALQDPYRLRTTARFEAAPPAPPFIQAQWQGADRVAHSAVAVRGRVEPAGRHRDPAQHDLLAVRPEGGELSGEVSGPAGISVPQRHRDKGHAVQARRPPREARTPDIPARARAQDGHRGSQHAHRHEEASAAHGSPFPRRRASQATARAARPKESTPTTG